MAENSKVDISIEHIPAFKGAITVSKALGYGLENGVSAETAGGLLLSVPSNQITIIETELKNKQIPAFRVGKVLSGTGKVYLAESLDILEVRAVGK